MKLRLLSALLSSAAVFHREPEVKAHLRTLAEELSELERPARAEDPPRPGSGAGA